MLRRKDVNKSHGALVPFDVALVWIRQGEQARSMPNSSNNWICWCYCWNVSTGDQTVLWMWQWLHQKKWAVLGNSVSEYTAGCFLGLQGIWMHWWEIFVVNGSHNGVRCYTEARKRNTEEPCTPEASKPFRVWPERFLWSSQDYSTCLFKPEQTVLRGTSITFQMPEWIW